MTIDDYTKELYSNILLLLFWNERNTTHFFKFEEIIIVIPWEFFTSALASGISLEFEQQQVSSSL